MPNDEGMTKPEGPRTKSRRPTSPITIYTLVPKLRLGNALRGSSASPPGPGLPSGRGRFGEAPLRRRAVPGRGLGTRDKGPEAGRQLTAELHSLIRSSSFGLRHSFVLGH